MYFVVGEGNEAGHVVHLRFVVAPNCPVSCVVGFTAIAHPATDVDKTTRAKSFFMSNECDLALRAEVCWFWVETSHDLFLPFGSGTGSSSGPFFV